VSEEGVWVVVRGKRMTACRPRVRVILLLDNSSGGKSLNRLRFYVIQCRMARWLKLVIWQNCLLK
jgi:hypothetical protein